MAALVLALVVVPLVGILSSGKTDQQSEEGMSEAVAFCQDMMEKVVSNNLPFQAVDPGGGADYVKGGPGGAFAQAGFRDLPYAIRGQDFKKADLEKILSDGDATLPDGKYRSKRVKGKTYYVSFFAGKYPDRDGVDDSHEDNKLKRSDFGNTLTFSYHPNPADQNVPWAFAAPAEQAKFNTLVILNGTAKVDPGGTQVDTNPYSGKSYLVLTGAKNDVQALSNRDQLAFSDPQKTVEKIDATKRQYSLITGWPDPVSGGNGDPAIKFDLNDTGSDQRDLWMKHLREIARRDKKPTLAYHPVVLDQRSFNSPNGALMKVVLGVKFYPYEHSSQRRNTGDMREFWLVSLKANLEE